MKLELNHESFVWFLVYSHHSLIQSPRKCVTLRLFAELICWAHCLDSFSGPICWTHLLGSLAALICWIHLLLRSFIYSHVHWKGQKFHKSKASHGGYHDYEIDAQSTGSFAPPFACLLAPLTYLLAPHCTLQSHALLSSFVRSLAQSLTPELTGKRFTNMN